MTFFVSQRVNKFSPCTFRWLNNGLTPNIQPSTFLVIIKPISIYEITILDSKPLKPLFDHRKLQGKNLFALSDTKNVIFQASADHFEQFLWLKWSSYMC